MKQQLLKLGLILLIAAGFIAYERGLIPVDKVIRKRIAVPNVVGLNEESSRILCRIAGFTMNITEHEYSDDFAKGIITKQKMPPGEKTAKTELHVVQSKGKAQAWVPDLAGLRIEQALKQLADSALRPGKIERIFSEVKKGDVIKTSPFASTALILDAEVDIFISDGMEQTIVPKLIGKTLAKAKTELKKYGLKIAYIKKETDIDKLFGIVLRQHPNAGKKVDIGTSVTLVINEEED